MQSKKVLWLLALPALLLSDLCMHGQSNQPKFQFTIDPKCVGVLIDSSTRNRVGSGFIMDDPKTVVTARHVAVNLATNEKRELIYEPPSPPGSTVKNPTTKLKPAKDVAAVDVAVLRIEGNSPCRRNLKRSNVDVKPGYWVVYAGLDTASAGFKVSSHFVRSISVEQDVKYIEIEGDARPGYSGGPVFDQQGGILGVVLRGRPSPSSSNWLFDAVAFSEVPR
jgi:S1-C subfamily serine protease